MRSIRCLRTVIASASGVLLACGGDGGSHEPPVDTRPRTVPVFTTHLTDPAGITQIVPPGSVAGDEIKGHSFIRHDGRVMPLYAPVDMELKRGTYVAQSNDYGLEFEINGRFRLRLGHVELPRADIRALLPVSGSSQFTEFAQPLSFAPVIRSVSSEPQRHPMASISACTISTRRSCFTMWSAIAS